MDSPLPPGEKNTPNKSPNQKIFMKYPLQHTWFFQMITPHIEYHESHILHIYQKSQIIFYILYIISSSHTKSIIYYILHRKKLHLISSSHIKILHWKILHLKSYHFTPYTTQITSHINILHLKSTLKKITS